MSGRQWIKLATKLHTDPAMMMIPREALGNWCLCLSLAGANDDDGRLGTVAEVAWHLRLTEADVTDLVDTMRGRLAIVDGIVTVRDWCQWQPPRDVTNAKRQAEHRARKAVTESNGVTAVTVTALDVEIEKEQKKITTSGTAGAVPVSQASPVVDPWVPVCEALAGLYGGVGWRDKRTGERLAWVGQSVGILGKHCGDDPARALVAVAKFKASDRAKFAPKPRDLPPVLGQWCEAVSPKRADDGAAFDERYHARLDGGRVVLRDPSLTIAALGLSCNPHDPATWPSDMRAAYAARIHIADGREVFA